MHSNTWHTTILNLFTLYVLVQCCTNLQDEISFNGHSISLLKETVVFETVKHKYQTSSCYVLLHLNKTKWPSNDASCVAYVYISPWYQNTYHVYVVIIGSYYCFILWVIIWPSIMSCLFCAQTNLILFSWNKRTDLDSAKYM